MHILRTKQELLHFIAQAESSALNSISTHISIGLVPTMGALHAGHASLIQASLANNTTTIVSIFINPMQFAPNEDFASYPRTFEADCALCEKLGVHAVFAPHVEEMYPSHTSAHNDITHIMPPESMGYVLEGFMRPTHFAGVLLIVLKLLLLTRAHNAYFGQKDAQQLLLIKRMVRDLCVPVCIHGCPIVRDSDGLALSSRNIYLSTKDRAQALHIPKALEHIHNAYLQGITSAASLKHIGLAYLKQSHIHAEYLEIIDESLHSIDDIQEAHSNNQASIIALVARIGTVRLLDNLWLGSAKEEG